MAFQMLPKTFQDAVTVSRAIGLQYLWIDSLCIVQDDDEDWRQEPARMGSIYEKARLTIAASGAKDSTEGCFISERSRSSSAEIPYYSSINDKASSMWVSMLPQDDPSPACGPLRRRAWALQEWRLSRRVVHFTRGGLSWKCKELELDERRDTLDMEEYPEWAYLLEQYTTCQLTHETDRLIALQGLANEMQKARHDEYFFGIWTADLPEQLLWMRQRFRPEVEDPPGLPSWTWASKTGPKWFWPAYFQYVPLLREITSEHITTEDSGVMRIQGSLKRCRVSEHEISKSWFPDAVFRASPEVEMRKCRDEAIHYIQDPDSNTQDILGLAALDGEPCSDIYCLFAISSRREKADPLYYDPSETDSISDSTSNEQDPSFNTNSDSEETGSFEDMESLCNEN